MNGKTVSRDAASPKKPSGLRFSLCSVLRRSGGTYNVGREEKDTAPPKTPPSHVGSARLSAVRPSIAPSEMSAGREMGLFQAYINSGLFKIEDIQAQLTNPRLYGSSSRENSAGSIRQAGSSTTPTTRVIRVDVHVQDSTPTQLDPQEPIPKPEPPPPPPEEEQVKVNGNYGNGRPPVVQYRHCGKLGWTEDNGNTSSSSSSPKRTSFQCVPKAKKSRGDLDKMDAIFESRGSSELDYIRGSCYSEEDDVSETDSMGFGCGCGLWQGLAALRCCRGASVETVQAI
ncbi:Hypp7022 [Branchiostoma lanceolatum]|uniref:Hypp7022 protein n=1 Tax=Branchiostoma lanceolatum TaxID=7740 RepID=A0A8K0EB82_BRALA|nr:Hypp7022 [Branchiostoma lanceolatum]